MNPQPEHYWVGKNPQHGWVILEPVRPGYSVSAGAFSMTLVPAAAVEYVRRTGKLPPKGETHADATD